MIRRILRALSGKRLGIGGGGVEEWVAGAAVLDSGEGERQLLGGNPELSIKRGDEGVGFLKFERFDEKCICA